MQTWATLDDNVETVTARTMPLMVARWSVAIASATLVGFSIGISTAAIWLSAVVVSESWTWRATDAQRHGRAASLFERRIYVGSIVFMNIVWCSLSVVLWTHDRGEFLVAALCLLAAQLLHAQTFTAHSPAMLAVVGGFPALTLIGLVGFAGSFSLEQRFLMIGAAAVMLAYSASAARVNFRREMRLAAARDAEIEANRAKGLYLSVISHEIRTPLNGVLGLAQSLASAGLPATQSRQAEILVQSGHAMLRMLNDVLDIAKFEAGALPVERRIVRTREVLKSLESLWSEQFLERSLSFEFKVLADAPETFVADDGRVLQVLNNLIGNALKFTREGFIKVEVTRSGSDICISVIDSGSGIHAEDVEKLFQPYVQARRTDGRGVIGTGLGLFISRQFARSMGGDIELSSVPGKGTRVSLKLPLQQASDEVAILEKPVAASGLNVLVIEDHPVNRLVATTLLESFGSRVVTAGTGQSGLELAKSLSFDLVLLDINLPDMDGRDAAEHLRHLGPMLVAMTAETSEELIKRLPMHGFADLLPKPLLAQRMAIILERCASHKLARAGASR